MQESVKDVSAKITENWNSLSKPKKIAIGSVVGAVVVGIGISAVVATQPKMEVLYSNLSIQEAAQVVEILDTEKIPYELSNGGQTITLDAGVLDQAKIVLARENVPKGKYTFEDALNNTMSTTETEKNAKMHRLKETEIETTLETIAGVDKADVSLVIPEEKNSFIASKQESSASILLVLSDRLSPKQIEGIARLVVNSVENLQMQNISIVDNEGNTLFSGEVVNELDVTNKQDLKTKSEKELVSKITNLLGGSYDDVRVSPNLVFNFDEYAEAREEYTPVFKDNPRGMISSEKTHDSTGSTTNSGGGIPGTTPNGGEAPTNQLVGESSQDSSEVAEKDIQYVNNKVVTNLTKDVGTLDTEKSSVGIQVYLNKVIYRSDAEEQGIEWEAFKEQNKRQSPIPISEETTNLIQQATGLKNVAVQGFEKPVFVDDIPEEEKGVSNTVLMILLGIASAIIAVLAIKAKKNKESEIEIETDFEDPQIDLIAAAEEEDPTIPLKDIEVKEGLETKQRIEKFADEKPEIVANILRNWITDNEWEDEF